MSDPATTTEAPRPARQWAGFGRRRPGQPIVLRVNPEVFDAEKIRAAENHPGLLYVIEGDKSNE